MISPLKHLAVLMFLKQYKNFRINVLFQFHEFSEDKWNFSALMLSINRQIVVIVVGSIPVFSPGTLSLLIEGIDPAESQLNPSWISATLNKLRIPSDGEDWIGAKIRTKKIPRTFHNTPKINPQQEPMGHGLLTPKHFMQNFWALKLIKH